MIEVAVASVISMISLIFLASLFTLAISQNRMVKNFTSTTTLAQEKIEELNAIEFGDDRMKVGGNLHKGEMVADIEYFEDVYVDEHSGTIQVNEPVNPGDAPIYRRFWQIENDPELINTIIISVRVASLQPGHNIGRVEETTLTTVRSH
jgi:hypothetical protein